MFLNLINGCKFAFKLSSNPEETSDLQKFGKPTSFWIDHVMCNSPGPGCSSVAYGASEEIGPFRINRNGSSLYLNKYSWSRGNNCTFKYLTKQNFLSLLSDFEVLNLYANRSKYSLPRITCRCWILLHKYKFQS